MKTFYLITAFAFILLSGCSKNEKSDCIESVLNENNMIAYDDQEIGCKSFFELYEFQNKQFFLLNNYCADIISYPIDCDGNTLCENWEDTNCNNFYANAVKMEIIGIDE